MLQRRPHSSFFGGPVFWANEAQLGWRTGTETAY